MIRSAYNFTEAQASFETMKFKDSKECMDVDNDTDSEAESTDCSSRVVPLNPEKKVPSESKVKIELLTNDKYELVFGNLFDEALANGVQRQFRVLRNHKILSNHRA